VHYGSGTVALVASQWRHTRSARTSRTASGQPADAAAAYAATYAPAGAGRTLRVHSPDGNTFLRETTPWPPSWKYDAISIIRLRQSMRVCLKNNLTKFHPDLVWDDGILGFFEEIAQTRTTRTTTKRRRKNIWWVATCIGLWDQFLIQKLG